MLPSPRHKLSGHFIFQGFENISSLAFLPKVVVPNTSLEKFRGMPEKLGGCHQDQYPHI
jgi:hypothetical protein